MTGEDPEEIVLECEVAEKMAPLEEDPIEEDSFPGSEKPNAYTIGACIIASSGALLFGLDVGITGGVVCELCEKNILS